MTSDQHMSDEELGRYLAVADHEGDVPAEFRDRLWNELQTASASQNHTQEPAHYVALGESPSPADGELVAPTPLTPKRRPYITWAAAAAVAVVVALAGIALTQQNDAAPVASEGGTVPGDADLGDPEPPATVPSTSTAAPPDDPTTSELDFSRALGITEVGTNAVSVTFAATERTAFNATVRSGVQVASTAGGVVSSGESEMVTLSDLVPATTYTVEVTLTGPPSVVSSRLTFRTPADPDDPGSFDTPIRFESAELNGDRNIDVVTNLCAHVSFALLDPDDQSEIARSSSDGGACGTEHELLVADFASSVGKTVPYTVIIEVEAVDGGGPTGNVAITTLSVAE